MSVRVLRDNRVNVFGPSAFVSLAVLVAGLVPAAALQLPQRFELKAVQAAKPPVIDGAVDEEEWRGATVASDFVQFEPRRGAPAQPLNHWLFFELVLSIALRRVLASFTASSFAQTCM